MKKLLLIAVLIIATSKLLAQSLPQFDQYKFDKKNDYEKADSAVLHTANFLLSTPIDQNIPVRLKAGHFVMQWMEGTPDYTFSLEQSAIKCLSGKVDLMLLYMSSMAKFALENHSDDPKLNTINGVKIMLDYINNPASNVKKDKNLKRLADANDKGELEEFLSL